ncbi:hypothetical protein Tco_0769723 [Tanacetum coccineum]|uniref:Uncharacterized protein n=1 Tax=Tanacetum coccineum TaxID=301880 RepID=A0ABQ4ZDP5_9ASTR
MGNTNEPPVVKGDPKDWFKKLERPPTPDPEWNECKIVDSKPTQKWLSELAKAKKSSKTFDDLISTLIDFSTFAMNRLQISDLTQYILNDIFNLKGEEIVHLAAALRMFTRRILIQKRVEDLHLGVKSYQKKLNISRPLMHKELYKYSNGTLISVRDKLKDMLNNLEIGYISVMPRRRWSNLDKKRSRIMVKDINYQLLERRLMRSLEKFVGEREILRSP